jgi:hypothetical protein
MKWAKEKQYMVPEFVLNNVFNKIETPNSIVYWRECNEEGEGYVIYYPQNGSYHHTYRYPPNWINQ